MNALRVIEFDGQRLRAGPWQGDHARAYLAPLGGGPLPDPAVVRRCLDHLTARGYTSVVTAALPPDEQIPFLACGFDVHEELALLCHDLGGLADERPAGLRRGTRRDVGRVLTVDNDAFPPFWRLDGAGLREARTATPASRFRVNCGPEVWAYAVSGRSREEGFLQRLAVDPQVQGQGLGRRLTVDALWWMRRRGVLSVLVNTPRTNHGALALYRSVGFSLSPEVLAVLHRPLTDGGPPSGVLP